MTYRGIKPSVAWPTCKDSLRLKVAMWVIDDGEKVMKLTKDILDRVVELVPFDMQDDIRVSIYRPGTIAHSVVKCALEVGRQVGRAEVILERGQAMTTVTSDMTTRSIETNTSTCPPGTRSTVELRAVNRVDAPCLEPVQSIRAEVIGHAGGYMVKRVRVTIEFLDDEEKSE